MRLKTKLLTFLIVASAAVYGCVEDAFVDDSEFEIEPQAPTDLNYSDVVDSLNEFSKLTSGVPTYNAYGLVPFFEIIKVEDSVGNDLQKDVLNELFSIVNPDTLFKPVNDKFPILVGNDTLETVMAVFLKSSGQITLKENSIFPKGKYYVSVRMTTRYKGQVFSTDFEDAWTFTFDLSADE